MRAERTSSDARGSGATPAQRRWRHNRRTLRWRDGPTPNPRPTMWMSLEGDILEGPHPDQHSYLRFEADVARTQVHISESGTRSGAGSDNGDLKLTWQLSEVTRTGWCMSSSPSCGDPATASRELTGGRDVRRLPSGAALTLSRVLPVTNCSEATVEQPGVETTLAARCPPTSCLRDAWRVPTRISELELVNTPGSARGATGCRCSPCLPALPSA